MDWMKIREQPCDQQPMSDSEEEKTGQTPMSLQALLESLLELLLPRETVIEALRQLGPANQVARGAAQPSSP